MDGACRGGSISAEGLSGASFPWPAGFVIARVSLQPKESGIAMFESVCGYHEEMSDSRRCGVVVAAVAAVWAVAPRDALSQQGITNSLPASAVIGGRASDGFQSQGGVVGPWWSGSGTGAAAPASNGGFWFGFPGLGFGGSQGSTRGMNTFAPSVTTMPGAAGMMSDTRLVPFVSGVVPVVGSGYSLTPVTTAASLPLHGPLRSSIPMRSANPGTPASVSPGPSGMMQPSTPGARDRAKQLVMTGDIRLLETSDGATAAKAALADYRSAARFANDDADIEIRQAMLYEALGKRRDADRAIARAERIDGRLARPLETVPADAGGFLAPPSPGMPVIAVRGFAILEEIGTTTPPDMGEASGETHAILAWLTEAWAHRWRATTAAPAPTSR